MTVKELIHILQSVDGLKKVYISGSDALVEIKQDNVVLHSWGVMFR